MKKRNLWVIFSYLVAIGYLLLGYFLYDWSFHLVPYSKGGFDRKMALDAFVVGTLIAMGVLFLASTFLVQRRKQYAVGFYQIAFMIGLAIAIIGGTLVSFFLFRDQFGTTCFQVVGLLLVLYAPSALLYVSRKKAVA